MTLIVATGCDGSGAACRPPTAARRLPLPSHGSNRRRSRVRSLRHPRPHAAGEPSSLAPLKGKAVLIVNVASKCGLTPQYAGLQKLQDTYGDQGFSVIGFPCNQFLEQEPGTADEIAEFCSVNYGVTFPLFEKIEVNGPGRHPIYDELTAVPDAEAAAGDIQWNFEKFLVSPRRRDRDPLPARRRARGPRPGQGGRSGTAGPVLSSRGAVGPVRACPSPHRRRSTAPSMDSSSSPSTRRGVRSST